MTTVGVFDADALFGGSGDFKPECGELLQHVVTVVDQAAIDGVDQGEGLFSGETHPAITGPGKLTVKRPDDN